MTTPSNYFYDGQIRRFISQFIRLVSNFYVEFGKDASGVTSLQRVPVLYGDPSRQAAQIIRNNSENALNSVPAMAVYINGLSYHRERLLNPTLVQSMQLRQREFDSVTGTYTQAQGDSFTVERLMPAPYTLSLKLDIWTSNTEQKFQLIEQLSALFNPAVELQSTDNYIDWTSLTYAVMTDISWSSRTVPTGGEEPIDIATLTFDLPIYISTSAKVKKMGVVQGILTNVQDLSYYDLGNYTEGSYNPFDNTGAGLLSTKNITLLNYLTLYSTDSSGNITLKLLSPKDVVTANNEYVVADSVGLHSWENILGQFGVVRNGSTQIRITQSNESEIVGSITLHPTDPSLLIYNPFPDTLPANTIGAINAVINPLSINVDNLLLSPAAGTRYLLTEDIGSVNNTQGALAWRGANNVDLVAHAGDIIEYNGQHWFVLFDSRGNDALQYVTNLTTKIQYKFINGQWTKSTDGIYPGGEWNVAI